MATNESTPHITGAELRIMKVLWDIEAGTVRQVLDRLPVEGTERPAYTTIMTMMKQLAEKGALRVDRERQPFVYSPDVPRESVLASRVTQFLHNVFDGQAADLVLHLAEFTDLSPSDLRRIEEKIRAREQIERSEEAANRGSEERS